MNRRAAYMDTCLLVPLFVKEKGSAAAREVAVEYTRGGELLPVISELTCLEFESAIGKHVRMGSLTTERGSLTIKEFLRRAETEFIILPVHTAIFRAAREMLAEPKTPLRSLDALQLALAHNNNCVLVTSDRRLAAAAALLDVEHHYVPYA